MFILDNYIKALLESLEQESDEKKKGIIIKEWVKLLKKHHRLSAGVLEKVKEEIGRREQKVTIWSADDYGKDDLENYFKKRNVKVKWIKNPDLMSGWKILWNNNLIDNTLRHQLRKLKVSLKK